MTTTLTDNIAALAGMLLDSLEPASQWPRNEDVFRDALSTAAVLADAMTDEGYDAWYVARVRSIADTDLRGSPFVAYSRYDRAADGTFCFDPHDYLCQLAGRPTRKERQAAEEAAQRKAAFDAAESAPLDAGAAAVAAIAGDDGYTRQRARQSKGYDATQARRLFDSDPSLRLVVVSGVAPTHRGLEYVGRSSVMYYRKSSGGKWGRSVQQRFVRVKPTT